MLAQSALLTYQPKISEKTNEKSMTNSSEQQITISVEISKHTRTKYGIKLISTSKIKHTLDILHVCLHVFSAKSKDYSNSNLHWTFVKWQRLHTHSIS